MDLSFIVDFDTIQLDPHELQSGNSRALTSTVELPPRRGFAVPSTIMVSIYPARVGIGADVGHLLRPRECASSTVVRPSVRVSLVEVSKVYVSCLHNR